MSLSSCGSFERVSHGRQGIGVVQPQSGNDYPLIQPSEEVRYLLADCYLAFDQPSDYDPDASPFVLPFRVHWLWGFGCEPPDYDIPLFNSAESSYSSICSSAGMTIESLGSGSSASATQLSCLPIPKHQHDIIIVDANGRIVFDSTEALVTHEARDWSDRLCVVTWRHPTNATLSVVYHTAWNDNDDPEPRTYKTYFFPENATLDERAIERLPKRVRSLTVILDNLRRTAVEFHAGYNMLLEAGDTDITDGARHSTRVTFNATPGAGIGVFPGCEPEPLYIRTINGVGPTDEGDFYLAATDCYWVRQPSRLLDTTPRITLPEIALLPGSVPTLGLPHPDAGTAKNLPGWPLDDDPRYAHLQIGNDCGPCCDCDDYVAVANYMNDLRDTYQAVGEQFEASRDLYHNNRDRWLEAACCFESRPLRLLLVPQICPYIDVGIQICNQSDECLTNVELVVDLTTSPGGAVGAEVPGWTFITGAANRTGRSSARTERYRMGGSWPQYTAFFDAVQPGQSASARFRLVFDENCGILEGSASGSVGGDAGSGALAVTATLTATANDIPLYAPDCDSLPNTVVAQVTETRTLDCPTPPGSTTNALICACENL